MIIAEFRPTYNAALAAEVSAMAKNLAGHPHRKAIEARLIQAAHLVEEGKVWPPSDWTADHRDAVARVDSPERRGIGYSIHPDPWHYELSCDCSDYVYGQAPILPSGQRACIHILAYQLTKIIAEKEILR